ncbi:hypothetical protein DSC91_003316 [Paraburkholderia caffeinilytica]|jgi:uncharacterized protein DUF6566|uniref:DUF6566 domain-containing protein n=1 Tax=Paraburkholderia caffeinilytica TaxID=1761016 RepID=A0ABQ1NI40_9BURK|nr:DUF6566 family protein [Paraburkholderia caffeinilytica]AXL48583.1 hypothetical protein DSC91_000013 [Paraburkholderia caffeinilytica]AXL50905.1 hypothetical protein DSC91_003316 [Paraburkholderia caffeinilytica]GGC73920.1 hypothetical protein GCM10011400_72650 [Paraburkholderia caffeinilytica]CAB3809593.1 hypothetical protein LMG28690_07333 [Paraburkholderia caffeinilytica]
MGGSACAAAATNQKQGAPVSDVTQESWKGHAIRIRTIPVRQILTRMSAPDGYIAIVRIDRNDEVLADWHLPRFSERWTSAAEAQRDAVEYAVKLIDRGVPGAIEAQGALAT